MKLDGTDIRVIRKYILVMSQREFAEMVGLSQGYIGRMELGLQDVSRNANEKILRNITRYIDMETLEKVLSGEINIYKGE